jgi:hypothetical protein
VRRLEEHLALGCSLSASCTNFGAGAPGNACAAHSPPADVSRRVRHQPRFAREAVEVDRRPVLQVRPRRESLAVVISSILCTVVSIQP